MKPLIKSKFLIFLFLLFSFRVLAEIPDYSTNVLDETKTLSPSDKESIDQAIKRAQDTADLLPAVYLKESLEGEAIETLAVDVFKKWQLGSKGKDNGLLILVVPSEHKMRIEVGYGLEGKITDYHAKMVILEIMRPAFRKGNFREGIEGAIDRLIQLSQAEIASPKVYPWRPDVLTRLLLWIALMIILPIIVGFPLALFFRFFYPERAKEFAKKRFILRFAHWIGFPGKCGAWRLIMFWFPGFLVVIDPTMDDLVSYGRHLFFDILLFGIPLILFGFTLDHYFSLFSLRRYKRRLARERLKEIRLKHVESVFFLFGKQFQGARRTVFTDAAGITDSSDGGGWFGGGDGSGSSSDGGSSGGGGASGDW